MRFCRKIGDHVILYDPVSNKYYLDGITPIEVTLGIEYQIVELVEQAEIAGFSTSEILYLCAGLLI